jgi:hypothetical protein
MTLRKLGLEIEYHIEGNLKYFRSRASAFALNVFKVYVLKMSPTEANIGLASAQTSLNTLRTSSIVTATGAY